MGVGLSVTVLVLVMKIPFVLKTISSGQSRMVDFPGVEGEVRSIKAEEFGVEIKLKAAAKKKKDIGHKTF